MNITILTGASRGMGLGIARGLLKPGSRLLTLQRKPNAALDAEAARVGCRLEQWAVDLTEPVAAAEHLVQWLTAASATPGLQRLSLINNAALLAAPGRLSGATLADLQRATRASLEAPLLLTAAFLSATDSLTGIDRRVLNISSGLGRFAMAGAASYCAAKAGMDHFSRAVALEEATKPHGARIASLAPGVIDTDMQVQLRGADPAAFSEQARFAQMKQSGGLDSIDAAAAKVLAWLDREDFGREVVADVRQG
jgi:benzil reductase ((S)-benzoin forming)